MRSTDALHRSLSNLRRSIRHAVANADGDVHILSPKQVKTAINVGESRSDQSASASQHAPIIQNGRRRG
jgi:hypothetical protein